MKSQAAVLIPCYNEAGTIAKVVSDFKSALPGADIYVYDNNSTDGTDAAAREAGAIVRYEMRQGKGNVIRTMFRDIEAEYYLIVDGDGTYPADHAAGMVQAVQDNKADMVIGDRLSAGYFQENDRRFHNAGNVLVCRLINILFHGHIADIMTGYRAFSYLFVKSFPILSQGFEIETEMTIHALDKNFRILSVPVPYRNRMEGSTSKLHTIRDGFRVVKTIFTLFKDYKPLPFFGIVSAFLLVTAVILFIPIGVTFLETHEVPRFPTLIISSFLALGSLQSLTCGLILDAETKKSRQNFELLFHMLNAFVKNK